MAVLNPIILSCWTIFLFYWGISAFFVKKSVTKRNWKKNWIFLLLILLFIFVAKLQHDVINIFTVPLFNVSEPLMIIGTSLVVIGLIVAVWARTVLGRNWSGYVTSKENHELVTSGPYSLIRHPIYTGVILMIIGTFLNFPSIYLLVMMIILITLFLIRVRKEEEIMIKLFGKKYLDYKKRTKALIPYIA